MTHSVPPTAARTTAEVPQLNDTLFSLPRAQVPRSRIDAVDLLRGIVMVLMLLDHTADYSHWARYQFDPTDLTRTDVAMFFTRWITHYCAPIFVFLAGTSTYLQKIRGKTPEQLSKLLVTRGLWLILLEITVIRFSVFYSLDYRFFAFLQVIFATGLGMIVLAPLVRWRVPTAVIGGIGVAIIVLHNALDGIRGVNWTGPPAAPPSFWDGVWHVLHQQGLIAPFGFPGPVAFVLYPVLPWIGVIMAGYALGRVYDWDRERRRTWLIRFGLAASAAFIVLRAINVYGDPSRWSVQKNAAFTLLSFLNTTKYPPSLVFLLMTLGPAIALLGVWDGKRFGRVGDFFVTFGRVPLFFYVLQWQVSHLAAIALIAFFQGGFGLRRLMVTPIDWSTVQQPRAFNLWVVYLLWIGGALLLYPLCKWFARLKARRRDWWLSYL